ncbi:hypothetical protein Unana1_06442 [Umbelopsis nana]
MSARNFFNTGRKIVAIGRNYSEHAKELGNAVPKSPFFFLKPTSSFLANGGSIEVPQGCDVHHEIELAAIIGREARDVKAADALNYVDGWALAIDMTARDLQAQAKSKGLPWSAAKGFDTFTPISDFIPKNAIPDPHNVSLWLKVNDTIKQNGNTKDMIFDIAKLIEYVSTIMKLEAGDVLLTGTPSGVGPIHPGDVVTAGMKPANADKDLVSLKFDVIERKGNYKN